MSALAGSAAEVATGSRKKSKKVNKASRKDDIAERALQQLETLQLRPPLTNGTNDHSIEVPIDHACTPTIDAPREFGGPQIQDQKDDTSTIDAPKEFGDTQVSFSPGELVGTSTLEAPFGFGGTQTPSSPSELEGNQILNAPVGNCGSQVSMESSEGTAGLGDSLNCKQLPSILNLTAHSDHCKDGFYGQKMHLLENLEEALVSLESALEEQRAAARQDPVEFVSYESELQMGEIMRLIQNDLSEPYSIYTYRYFIHNWPKLCFLAMVEGHCIGAVVCKLDLHRNVKRGYIAMLAVDEKYRKRKIGSRLVHQAIQAMIQDNADEVVLETEITNKPALRLYENLGFVRDKRLFRYYLNGVDALRLKLWLR